jgi:hypothetical protein
VALRLLTHAKRMIRSYCAITVVLLVLIVRPTDAADRCDLVAAKIAQKTRMTVAPRVPANFIPMTQPDGDYGAHLKCNGSRGITLHAMSPPHPPEDWFRFFAQAASVLTGDAPDAVYKATKRCQAQAEQTSDGFADLRSIICDIDGDNLEVFIPEQKYGFTK